MIKRDCKIHRYLSHVFLLFQKWKEYNPYVCSVFMIKWSHTAYLHAKRLQKVMEKSGLFWSMILSVWLKHSFHIVININQYLMIQWWLMMRIVAAHFFCCSRLYQPNVREWSISNYGSELIHSTIGCSSIHISYGY